MHVACIPARTDAVRTLGFAAIGAAYASVGTTFAHAVRMMRLVNMTDADMLFTDNITMDKWPVPHGSFVLYDYSANSKQGEGNLAYPAGTQISVKQVTAPTTGSVYVECTYAQGQ
jgi:hypothetical protein